MGRNVNNNSAELLRIYAQTQKTALASSISTASFDPLTFGSITSESIYKTSVNAFISASNASFTFSADTPPSESIRRNQLIINDVSKSDSDLEVYTPSPYTSSNDIKEFRYIVWDTTNQLFYEYTTPTIEYVVSTTARETRFVSPTYTNYVRPETYLLKIPINSTISDFITTLDSTFQTDASATPISASLASKLTLTGSLSGWNDTSASVANVPINGLYYTTNGSIKVRLT